MNWVWLTRLIDGVAVDWLINLDKVRDVGADVGNRCWVRFDDGELMLIDQSLGQVLLALRSASNRHGCKWKGGEE